MRSPATARRARGRPPTTARPARRARQASAPQRATNARSPPCWARRQGAARPAGDADSEGRFWTGSAAPAKVADSLADHVPSCPPELAARLALVHVAESDDGRALAPGEWLVTQRRRAAPLGRLRRARRRRGRSGAAGSGKPLRRTRRPNCPLCARPSNSCGNGACSAASEALQRLQRELVANGARGRPGLRARTAGAARARPGRSGARAARGAAANSSTPTPPTSPNSATRRRRTSPRRRTSAAALPDPGERPRRARCRAGEARSRARRAAGGARRARRARPGAGRGARTDRGAARRHEGLAGARRRRRAPARRDGRAGSRRSRRNAQWSPPNPPGCCAKSSRAMRSARGSARNSPQPRPPCAAVGEEMQGGGSSACRSQRGACGGAREPRRRRRARGERGTAPRGNGAHFGRALPVPAAAARGAFRIRSPRRSGIRLRESEEMDRLIASRERIGPVNLVAADELAKIEEEHGASAEEQAELAEAVQPAARLDRQSQPRGPRTAARRLRGGRRPFPASCSPACSKAGRRISRWSIATIRSRRAWKSTPSPRASGCNRSPCSRAASRR